MAVMLLLRRSTCMVLPPHWTGAAHVTLTALSTGGISQSENESQPVIGGRYVGLDQTRMYELISSFFKSIITMRYDC